MAALGLGLVFGQDHLCVVCKGTGWRRWVSGNGGPVHGYVKRETADRANAGEKLPGVHRCGTCQGQGLIRALPSDPLPF